MARPACINVFLQKDNVTPHTYDNQLYLPKNIKTYELFENIMNSVMKYQCLIWYNHDNVSMRSKLLMLKTRMILCGHQLITAM